MNLSEFVIPSKPGTTGLAPGIVRQGENPLESGPSGDFADLFSATVGGLGEAVTTESAAASDLLAGKDLPEAGGRELPLAAAGLPLALSQLALSQLALSQLPTPLVNGDQPAGAEASNFSMPSGLKTTTQGDARPGTPVPSQVSALVTTAEVSVSAAKEDGADAAATAPQITMELRALKALDPARSGSVGVPEADLPAPAPQALADKTVAPEQAARFLPVAQLLRSAADAAAVEDGAVTFADGEASGQRPAASSGPVTAPAPALATTAQLAAPMAAGGDAARPAAVPAQVDPSQQTQRHDFGQVVERLAEARELARPARAEMQVPHREFGPVTMQFDVTGTALKVALANAHVGFAPAVQTALAERTFIAGAESARMDMPTQQQGQSASQSSSQSSGQSSAQSGGSSGAAPGHQHGDAQQQQRQQETARTPTGQTGPRQAEGGEQGASSTHDGKRDTALFA